MDHRSPGNEQLLLAKDAAGLGIHEYDVVSGRVFWDPRVRQLWGIGPDEPITYELFMGGLHPDDRAATQAAVERALDPSGAGRYLAEYRVISRADGVERWVAATGQTFFEAGRAVRLVGTVQDVTDRRRTEEELRASEERLRIATESAGMFVWECLFTAGRIVWSSNAAAVIGCRPEDLPMELDGGMFFVHVDDLETIRQRFRRAVAARDTTYALEFRGCPRLVPGRHYQAHLRLFFDAEGQPVRSLGVTQDITAGKESERRLVEATRAAEEATRAKDDFLARLSHELRTPLTPVVLLIDQLCQRTDLPQDVAGDLADIRRNVDLETRLIDDLLDLTRLMRGKIELQRQRCDMHELIDHAIDICRGERWRAKNLRLERRLEAGRPYVQGDPTRLRQVFWNLLNNAAKFTPAGGLVSVSSFNPSFDCLRIEVKDTGIGIEPEALPRLFAAFEQGSRQVTREFGGLGMGLVIARSLVEMHQGSISASSDGPGRGACFVVELPVDA